MSVPGIQSNGRNAQPTENRPDFGAMSRKELDRKFVPARWDKLSYDDRCRCLQELENRFAQEQGRPAKQVTFAPMKGGLYGVWNEATDTIRINENLVKDGAFLSKGRLVPQSDAAYQLYDTIAHEGFHAYQSYALAHPDIHADKQQLAEWRLNSEWAFPRGHYEDNYYSFDTDRDRYRLQALERDAFDYGNRRTMEAFDALEAEEGRLPGYADYKHSCEFDSYENALKSAQQKDPQTLSHMTQEMQARSGAWQRGEVCGEIGKDPKYNPSQAQAAAAQFRAQSREEAEAPGREPQGEEASKVPVNGEESLPVEEADGEADVPSEGEDMESLYAEEANGE